MKTTGNLAWAFFNLRFKLQAKSDRLDRVKQCSPQRMLEPKMQWLERYVTRKRDELWELRMQALKEDPNSLSNADPFGPYY